MIQQRMVAMGAGLLLFVWAVAAQRPAFEVISIKSNKSLSSNGSMGPRGSRIEATNVTLKTLLLYAYRPPKGQLLDAQIIGGPDWAQVEHFDIQAKAAGDAPILPGEQTRAMVRALLEDRFQLKAHREQRDLSVYNLVLTKKGPPLSEDQTPPDASQAFISVVSEGAKFPALPRGALRLITGATTTTLVGTAVPIATLVTMLQGQSDHIIFDKTGFDKLIDVHLEFSPNLTAAPVDGGLADSGAAPPLLTAIQQIGLKLEGGKAPVEVLVIDSVQRPSEN